MAKLFDRFDAWARKDERWPLLFFIGYPPLFYFVRRYFELSFRETFRHWCFLVICGALPILAGLLYIAIAPPKRRDIKQAGPSSLVAP